MLCCCWAAVNRVPAETPFKVSNNVWAIHQYTSKKFISEPKKIPVLSTNQYDAQPSFIYLNYLFNFKVDFISSIVQSFACFIFRSLAPSKTVGKVLLLGSRSHPSGSPCWYLCVRLLGNVDVLCSVRLTSSLVVPHLRHQL